MTEKEFLNLKPGDIILKGQRKAKVESIHPMSAKVSYMHGGYVNFRFLDTNRPSCRGYRGLKMIRDNK